MERIPTNDSDIESLCLPPNGNPGANALAEVGVPPKRRFSKKDGLFIWKMPLTWFLAATTCGIESMKVGAALWIRLGITKQKTFEFSLRQIGEMVNVNKSNVRRALLRLESAGLVAVHRQPRRRLMVTVKG